MTILKNEFTIKKAQKEKSPKKPLLKNSTKHLTELTPILHHFFKKKKKKQKRREHFEIHFMGPTSTSMLPKPA